MELRELDGEGDAAYLSHLCGSLLRDLSLSALSLLSAFLGSDPGALAEARSSFTTPPSIGARSTGAVTDTTA